MADDKLSELFKTQKSLTEWLEDIKHTNTEHFRKEDSEKRDRLKKVHQLIGLPTEPLYQFEAVDLRDDNEDFTSFLKLHGEEACQISLLPKRDGIPKLRMRGMTVKNAYDWYKEQAVNAKEYRVNIVQHPPDYSWATIFVVNRHGVQGEIIYGSHQQLTQGFHDKVPPNTFRYDFKKWSISPQNDKALAHLKKIITYIHIPDRTKQKLLEEQCGSTFVHDYLTGYFETIESSLGVWYIDYNQSLGKAHEDIIVRAEPPKKEAIITGQTGCGGKVTGTVCVVGPNKLDIEFPENGVLVCNVTTPDYIPLMQKAAAIVTNQGGILSHAAIVARELQVPCIVGTGSATESLKDGQRITVDADNGIVKLAE